MKKINFFQNAKIVVSRMERFLSAYFSAKGADLYTRFVRRIFLVLVISVFFAGIAVVSVLWISSTGAPLTKVPAVKSLDILRAAELIREKGLLFEINGKYETSIPRYQVIEQYPAQGLTVRKGRTIRLLVSLGKDTYEVPNLVGLSRGETEKLLKDLNIPYELQVVSVDDDQTNKVISQSVEAGATLDRSQKISLLVTAEVNRSHAKVRDYTKSDVRIAVSSLYEQGLIPRLEDTVVSNQESDGLVLSQSVSPGTIVNKNTTVSLRVGVYGEDELERQNFHYHIFRYYVPEKYQETEEGEPVLLEVPIQISVKDELREEQAIYDKRVKSGSLVTLTFKSYGTTHLFLIVDKQFVKEVIYE